MLDAVDEDWEAESELRRLVEAGDADAMCNLGVLLAQTERPDEAEAWLVRAARTGDLDSMSNLGNLLRLQGRREDAGRWLRRAAEQDHPLALFNLGVWLEDGGDVVAAEELYRRAADAGDTNAMTNLGVLLIDSGRLERAEEWLRRGAEAGDADAMCNLARLHEGAGRHDAARPWFLRAAWTGDAEAMADLARMLYADGDLDEARSWYLQAAARGDDDAQVWLRHQGLVVPPAPDPDSDPPLLVAIDNDDYHAEHVGHTADGRQFFLTRPFVPANGDEERGGEFVARYLFDGAGLLVEAEIDAFGPRDTTNEDAWRATYLRRLDELGEVTFGRIEVRPFAVERFGTTFGLVPRVPEDAEDVWAVELQPGNYMAFFHPWDSGDYDT